MPHQGKDKKAIGDKKNNPVHLNTFIILKKYFIVFAQHAQYLLNVKNHISFCQNLMRSSISCWFYCPGCCILYMNLYSSLLVSAVQIENVLFPENLLYFFTNQFTCRNSLLKSWLWLSYVILISFVNWWLFVGRWLRVSSKYTFKALKWNKVLKECCDLLVVLVMMPMQGDEGLVSLLPPN